MLSKDSNNINIIDKNICVGCTSCYNICTQNAITMKYNEEGFKYPIIDENKCTNCGLCKKRCPILYKKNNSMINKCYAAFNNNEYIRRTSSSGGIFELLAKKVLNSNGKVIGAAFNEENILSHVIIDNYDDLEKLKGSKYLQSNLENIFKHIKADLLNNKKLLFVGTPCQVAGLKTFLNKEYKNLYCCDFICHGVPSTKVFNKYIKELEEKNGKVIGAINFRNKESGWRNFSISIKQEKNNYIKEHSNDIYMKLFLSNISLRLSCYNCKFKNENRYSDLTLGDFWGIDESYPELNDGMGVSSVIVNTEKGDKIFNSIKNELIYKQCTLEDVKSRNTALEHSTRMNRNRDKFFYELDSQKTLSEIYEECVRGNILKRILVVVWNKII